ncbi:MAG: GGDEF domain-containing protein [Acidimicrobiia bacterium]|nr:GGDEF domain-containing protein [Acidimicrobiia bacterium]
MWQTAALMMMVVTGLTVIETLAAQDDHLATLASGLFPALGSPIAWRFGPGLSPRQSYHLGRLFLALGAISAAFSVYHWRGTPVAGAMCFYMVLVVVFAAVYFSRRDVIQIIVFESVLTLGALVADGLGVDDVLVSLLTLVGLIGTGMVLSTSIQASDLLSYGDPLTGAANRRAWDIVLGEAIARHDHDQGSLSVILLDIDWFKSVNDQFGHERGDEVLRNGVAAWKRIVRASDTVARLGGDEFAVLLPDVDLDGALDIAKALLATFHRSTGSTCSIGVASAPPAIPAGSLLATADEQLYGAKQSGRACVRGAAVASTAVDDAPIDADRERPEAEFDGTADAGCSAAGHPSGGIPQRWP